MELSPSDVRWWDAADSPQVFGVLEKWWNAADAFCELRWTGYPDADEHAEEGIEHHVGSLGEFGSYAHNGSLWLHGNGFDPQPLWEFFAGIDATLDMSSWAPEKDELFRLRDRAALTILLIANAAHMHWKRKRSTTPTPKELKFLDALQTCHTDGYEWAIQKKIATRAVGIRERDVRNLSAPLQERGWVEKNPGGQGIKLTPLGAQTLREHSGSL